KSKDKAANGKKQQNPESSSHAVPIQPKRQLLSKDPQDPALFHRSWSSSANHAQLGVPSASSFKMTSKGDVDNLVNDQAAQKDKVKRPRKWIPWKAVTDKVPNNQAPQKDKEKRPRKGGGRRDPALAEAREIIDAADALVKLSKEAW
ncbi:MAG: hypothetical protein Q9226_007182, partial [Calogaya cf. arnoldii]